MREFQEFLDSTETPPSRISEGVVKKVRQELNPSAWSVFAKLALIHALTSLGSLSLCPQFGVHVFGNGIGLMDYFMKMGSVACMGACGAIFVGASLLVASAVLRPEEVRVIRKNRLLELGALSFLSLGVFVMLDAQIVLAFAAAWALGSLLGGIATLELGWFLRTRRFA